MDIANALSPNTPGHPRGILGKADIKISTSNGSIQIAGYDPADDAVLIEYTHPVTGETRTATLLTADLQTGPVPMEPPSLTPLDEARLDDVLIAFSGLWAYLSSAYPEEFVTTTQIVRDGGPISDTATTAYSTTYMVTGPDQGRQLGVQVTVPQYDGTELVVTTAGPPVAAGSVTFEPVSLNGVRIDATGMLTPGRQLYVLAVFGAVREDVANQQILSISAAGNDYDQNTHISLLTNGDVRTSGRDTGDAGPGNWTTTTNGFTATPQRGFVSVAIELDNAGAQRGATRIGIPGQSRFVASGPSPSAAQGDTLPLSTLSFFARPDGSEGMATDTTLEALWVFDSIPTAANVGGSDVRDVRAAFENALFFDALAVTLNAAAPDGSVMISGTTYVPAIFIANGDLTKNLSNGVPIVVETVS